MPTPVQLIFADNPGSLPATYTLPPGLDLQLSSVVARVDGAAASATFIPCLSIYSQDDRLMARVRIDQEFSVGDTGVVTFAPFLRRRAAASSGSEQPSAYLQLTKASLQNTSDAEGFTSGSGFATNDSSVFGWTTPDRFITALANGRYVSEVYVGIDTSLVQWARAPVDDAVIGIGMCYFDPASPTPHALDQTYMDFGLFEAAFGATTKLNLTRHFLVDMYDLAADSCFQPLAFATPAAAALPAVGSAISFATLRVTRLGPHVEL